MIGNTWYFISTTHTRGGKAVTSHEIKSAQIIGETPRKWILRESGDWRDYTIFKTGPDEREGKGERRTRTFYATETLAQLALAIKQGEAWADKHAYAIGCLVQRMRDPVLLRKIAEMVGYKEEP